MGNWGERAAVNLIPLSFANSIGPAIAEWFYTGNFLDLEATDGVCELCNQLDLRYHFEIRNHLTHSKILVGSECIKRFDLTGVDDNGNWIDATETGRLVDRHRRGLVEDARKRRVMAALLKLAQFAPEFDAMSFIEFVDDKGAFTPKQVSMVFWKLNTFAINYQPRDWRVRLRRNSDLGQLRNLNPAAFERVWAALSPDQRHRIQKIETRFALMGQSWRE